MAPDLDTDGADLVMPLLLADALRTYGFANRRALAAAGFGDIPRAGAQVIGRIDQGATTVGEVGMAFAASVKSGDLVDALVARGYVDRTPEADGPARTSLTLTERGAAAAVVLRRSVAGIDAALVGAVGADEICRVRRVLGVLAAQSNPTVDADGPRAKDRVSARSSR
jgi:hypothetical protein